MSFGEAGVGSDLVPVNGFCAVLLDAGSFGIKRCDIMGCSSMALLGRTQEPSCRFAQVKRGALARRIKPSSDKLRLNITELGSPAVPVRGLAQIWLNALSARIKFGKAEDRRQVILLRGFA